MAVPDILFVYPHYYYSAFRDLACHLGVGYLQTYLKQRYNIHSEQLLCKDPLP